jgi:hypothetical protein
MPDQRYIANDRRKDLMINHNESPGIEPESPDSKSNAQPIEKAVQLLPYLMQIFAKMIGLSKIYKFNFHEIKYVFLLLMHKTLLTLIKGLNRR